MSKFFKSILICIALIALVGCGKTDKYVFDAENVLSREDSVTVFQEVENSKGKSVTFLAKIFNIVTQDEKTYYQAFTDYENSDHSIMLSLPEGSDVKLSVGDYIEGNGVVYGIMEGENAFGADVSSVVVETYEVEVGDYAEIVARVRKSVSVDQTIEQNGFEISIKEIEFSDYDTRLHVEIKNNSSDNVSIYSFDFKIVANGKNYEEDYNYDIEYDEIDSDLSPNTHTSGTIGYKAMDYNAISQMQLIIDAPYSDNWDVDFEDYTFDIEL